MNASWRGETVRVVRVRKNHAWIVWNGMLKRVNARELEAL
jgi:hypothetical protein